jgi:DMSO/TMAO reductase YedYZ molybdopterin-dependent catalytic subunit
MRKVMLKNTVLTSRARRRPGSGRFAFGPGEPGDLRFRRLKRWRTDATLPIICVEGWDMWVRWNGMRLSELIRQVRPKQGAKWLTFYSYSEYTDSLSMEDAMDERTMLVYGLDGGDLPADNGGPLRLVVPFKLAYKSVKWVTRISFVDSEELGYWEVRGYPADAGIPDDKREAYGL